MNNDEAKFVLQAYRPDGRDAAEPSFEGALAQAKADPALGAWLARDQAHGAAVAARLREIAPPPGLREAILVGGRATERATARTARPGWTTWIGAAAAAIVLAGATVLLWPKPAPGAETLTAFAFDDVLHGRHGGHGVPEKTLQAQLSATDIHLAGGLPVDFSTLEHTGCRTLKVAGRDVLEVCFVRNGAEFHCYIGRAADFNPTLREAGAVFVQQAHLAAAAWTNGAYRFVVVGDAGLDAVKRLL